VVGKIPGMKEKSPIVFCSPNWIGSAAVIASSKFDNGPASATHMKAYRDFISSANGLTGTGFAQPNPENNSTIDPNGSRWAKGLRVRRPLFLGVSSPNRVAVQACANSWIVKATTSTSMRAIRVSVFRLNSMIIVRGNYYTICVDIDWVGDIIPRMLPDIQVGQIIRLRKPHPCGSYDWKIYRLGADIGLECVECGRRVMLPRRKVARRMKEILPGDQDSNP
jgi:hypothetical protein